MTATRSTSRFKIAELLHDSKKDQISIAEINIDVYLDAIEENFKGFQELTWWHKIRKVYNIGEISFDFYEDFIDETEVDKKQALKNIGFAGWEYVRDKFKISIPYIGPFQNQMVTKLIDMGVEAVYDRLVRKGAI